MSNQSVPLVDMAIYIKTHLNIQSQRLSKGKQSNFQPPKTMAKMLSVLKFKNDKIEKDLIMEKIKLNCSDLLQTETIQNLNMFAETELRKINQMPFEQRNQLAQFQYIKHRSSNTFGIFFLHQQIKEQAKKNSFLHQNTSIKQKQKINESQISNYQLENDLVGLNIFSQMDQQKGRMPRPDQEKVSQKINQNKDYKKQLLFNVRIKVDKLISEYLIGRIPLPIYAQMQKQLLLPLKVSKKQKVFGKFINLLVSYVQKSKLQKTPINQLLLDQLIEDYYLTNIDTDRKIQTHAFLAVQKNRKRKNQTQKGLENSQQIFWCKILIVLFSLQKGKNILIHMLENSRFYNFLDLFDSFRQGKQIENVDTLKQENFYITNIFYRIIVKVLSHETLQEDQIQVLNEDQSRILSILEHKYYKNFQTSQASQKTKIKLMTKLRQAIIKENVQESEKMLKRLIQIRKFGSIYFELFAQEQKSLSALQCLAILSVFLDNSSVLQMSLKDLKEQAQQCTKNLRKIVTSANSSNSQRFCTIVVRILQKVQKVFGRQRILDLMIQFLRMKCELAYNFRIALMIQSRCGINWDSIQNLIKKSIGIKKDQLHDTFKR